MTSRNLFFKRFKQDLEQRVWLPVVFFIIGFLMMELPLFFEIEGLQDNINPLEEMREYVLSSFFTPFSTTIGLTIGMAVVSGISGFFYMHSAKKLDVYHSIPIRREALFVQQYIYGVLYYLAPMLLHVLICLGICTTQGILNGTVLGQAVGFFLVQLLIYLAHYSVVVTAVCLTGNLVISILGTGVLLTYSLILSLIKYVLMEAFFTTYYSVSDSEEQIWAFSPVHLLIKWADADGFSEADYFAYVEYGKYYVLFILMAVVYTAFALFLYKKRSTEAANSNIAFLWAEPVIKTMVVLPVSLLAGFFFRAISYSYSLGWFLFGCIFGFVLCCPLMEIIFRKDIKAGFKHPLQIGINAVLVVAVLVIFRWDVFGYDSYVPAESKVESYAISLSGFSGVYPAYGDPLSYCMDNMEIRENESVRKLIEYGAETTRDVRTIADYDGIEYEEGFYTFVVVKYTLKNGREIHRNYYVNVKDEQVLQWLGEIYEDVQYKQGVYPVLNGENEYQGVSVKGTYSNDEKALSEEQMQKLVEVYRAELQNLTFEVITEEYPVAEMQLAVWDPWIEEVLLSENITNQKMDKETEVLKHCVWESGYPIYSSFTQTIALLKEYGLDWGEELPVENVISVYIEDSSREADDHDGYYDKISVALYSLEAGQREQIASILSAIRSGGLTRQFDLGEEDYPYISVEISYSYGDKEYEHQYYTFKKGMMPEFILQDLKPLEK